jgi:hypothetical protein
MASLLYVRLQSSGGKGGKGGKDDKGAIALRSRTSQKRDIREISKFKQASPPSSKRPKSNTLGYYTANRYFCARFSNTPFLRFLLEPFSRTPLVTEKRHLTKFTTTIVIFVSKGEMSCVAIHAHLCSTYAVSDRG